MKTDKTKFILLLAVGCIISNINYVFANEPVTNVWINEIHYDNNGKDINEGVEIAGPVNTDLSKFKLYFYNGYNGTVYDTHQLSGIIEKQTHSYGTSWFPVEGIQNGSPDAIALVFEEGDTVSVIQFISYEGTLTASGGPADGMTSTDIGIAEDDEQALNLSLQLKGRGKLYLHFSWIIATATPGAVNADQQVNPPTATAIVIR